MVYLDQAFAPLPVRVTSTGAVTFLAPSPGREAERMFVKPDLCLARTGW